MEQWDFVWNYAVDDIGDPFVFEYDCVGICVLPVAKLQFSKGEEIGEIR